MDDIHVLLKKYNKVFKNQIRRSIRKCNKLDINEHSKNNLVESGELLIYCIRMFEKHHFTLALPLLRNIYDMLLKALVMDNDKDTLNSYNDLSKDKTEKNDDSKNVRYKIGVDFSKFFSGIEFEPLMKEMLGDGILTYVYNMLCMYSHATKISEFAYIMEKNEEVNIIYTEYLLVFLLYPLIIFYLDGMYTKIHDIKSVAENYILFMSVICYYLLSIVKEPSYKKLKKYNDEFFGEPNETFISKINKEKEYSQITISRILEEIKNQDNQSLTEFDDFWNKTMKKYFKINNGGNINE